MPTTIRPLSKKTKSLGKEYICVPCGKEFNHTGCGCKAVCPECGSKGSSVSKDLSGKVYF